MSLIPNTNQFVVIGFLLSLSFLVANSERIEKKKNISVDQLYKVNSELPTAKFEVLTEQKVNKFSVLTDQITFIKVNEESYKCKSTISLSNRKSDLLNIPTSTRWKAPFSNCNNANAITYFTVNENGERPELSHRTFFNHSSDLNKFSIYIDENDFFDFYSGIYVRGVSELISDSVYQASWWYQNANYHQRGSDWERKAFLQYYDGNNELLTESKITVEINGNATRAFPIKSLRLNAEKSFNFSFFDKTGLDNYSSLILRNSGNDFERTYFADAFAHFICMDELHTVETQNYKPVLVYLNGAYWGIHNLRERIDDDFLAEKYKTKKKNITIMEGLELADGNESQGNEFNELYLWMLSNDMSKSENLARFKQEFHYQNYLQYLSVQLFCANTDWPGNNVKCYKITDKNVDSLRQKWNFVMWDMDYSFSYTGEEAYNTDMFHHIMNSTASFAKVFKKLMKNNQFKNELRVHLEEYLNSSVMENLEHYVDEFKSGIESEMNNHIERWRYPNSMEEWEFHIQKMKEFLSKRRKVLIKQMQIHLKNA